MERQESGKCADVAQVVCCRTKETPETTDQTDCPRRQSFPGKSLGQSGEITNVRGKSRMGGRKEGVSQRWMGKNCERNCAR